jgi:predicted cobalt transporter CbtA
MDPSRLLNFRAAVIAGTIAVVLVVLTFLPVGRVPTALPVALFLAVFPIFGASRPDTRSCSAPSGLRPRAPSSG